MSVHRTAFNHSLQLKNVIISLVVYDQEGNICLKFGGLMPPPKREIVKKFFENAENKGTIWECKQRHKKE